MFRKRILGVIRKFYPQFGFRDSDVILASFPKSGRNWVMFLLANTIIEVSGIDIEVNFLNIHDFIPGEFPTKSLGEGFSRIIASHKEYKGQPTRAIYLLRHPADVMVSYYHYLRGRWNKDVGEFSEFIRSPKYGIPAWIRHVRSWEGNWDILVRFEDLKKDSLVQLRKMVSIFDKDIKNETLETAVEKSSFENMKRIEEEKGLPHKKGANPNYTFMREGKYRKGKELFREKDDIYLNKVAQEILQEYGYE